MMCCSTIIFIPIYLFIKSSVYPNIFVKGAHTAGARSNMPRLPKCQIRHWYLAFLIFSHCIVIKTKTVYRRETKRNITITLLYFYVFIVQYSSFTIYAFKYYTTFPTVCMFVLYVVYIEYYQEYGILIMIYYFAEYFIFKNHSNY